MPNEPITQEGLPAGGQSPNDGLGNGNQTQPADQSQQGQAASEGKSFFDPKTVPAELKPAYDQMQSAFNQKMTEFDQKYKGYVKPFSELTQEEQISRFNELLTNPTFQGLATQRMQESGYQQPSADVSEQGLVQVAQQWDRVSEDQKLSYWNALDATSQELFRVYVNQARLAKQQQFLAKNQLESARQVEERQGIEKHGDSFKKLIPELRKMQDEQAQAGKAFSLDECYRINAFDEAKKEAFAAGKSGLELENANKQNVNQIGLGLPGNQVQPGEAKSMEEAISMAENQLGAKLP